MRRRRKLQGLYRVLPPGLQQAVIAAAGWRRYRERFGHHFERALETLERNDRLSEDGIRTDQELRLQRSIAWAAETVPYYKKLFRQNGIDPAGFRSLDDLKQLPTLDLLHVRDDKPECVELLNECLFKSFQRIFFLEFRFCKNIKYFL